MNTPQTHVPDTPGTQKLDDELIQMVERFQCPGCLKGGSTSCGAFHSENGMSCTAHRCGTFSPGMGYFALGMPKGFCRPGFGPDHQPTSTMCIRLWKKDTRPVWDKLNIAVWALELDGFLFVRTCMPRINLVITDVIEGGTLALCPGALNTADFANEFD